MQHKHDFISFINVHSYQTCCAVSRLKCTDRLSGVQASLGWLTHTSAPPQSGAISDSQAGSQGAVTGLLGLPGTLSISSLILFCRGRSETTVWVYTLTVRKSRETPKVRAQDGHEEKGHFESLNPPFPLSRLFFQQDKLLTKCFCLPAHMDLRHPSVICSSLSRNDTMAAV